MSWSLVTITVVMELAGISAMMYSTSSVVMTVVHDNQAPRPAHQNHFDVQKHCMIKPMSKISSKGANLVHPSTGGAQAGQETGTGTVPGIGLGTGAIPGTSMVTEAGQEAEGLKETPRHTSQTPRGLRLRGVGVKRVVPGILTGAETGTAGGMVGRCIGMREAEMSML